MIFFMIKRLLLITFIGLPLSIQAKGQYLSEQAFLSQVFGTTAPSSKSLWLKGQLKQDVKQLLGHNYGKIRIKYWQSAKTTAWVLDQIGKERPITAGFAVKDQQIQHTSVLAFRESRGWEVRRKAFTQQFEFAALTQDNRLSKHIDGITGATLSVNAMNRMAKLALRLHQEVQPQSDQKIN